MRVFIAFVLCAIAGHAQQFRPPAVPLVTHDPYFSIWSMNDRLTDGPTRHWTGTDHALNGIVRIDGKAFRFMGSAPREIPALPQVSLRLGPTRTTYLFEGGGIRLLATFITAAFPDDLDRLSRPASYLALDVISIDGRPHQVSTLVDASSRIAVNSNEQTVVASRYQLAELDALRAGSQEQPVLEKRGDNLRIDWGYLYLAAERAPHTQLVIARPDVRPVFAKDGLIPDSDDIESPVLPRDQLILLCAQDFGNVGTDPVSRRIILAYDDLFSLEYFHRRLRPWWRRNGQGAAGMLSAAHQDFSAVDAKSRQFDEELMKKLTAAGGGRFERIATLAFRQTVAAHKLAADLDGTPIFLSKENFSNGSIGTVDVTYPSAPFMLYFNPALLKAMLTPILDYASLPRWRWPYAPHDLGTYPIANGQTYGGGETSEDRQMPVEESGNMLILIGALAQKDGNANYALRYWPLLTKWAEYLKEKGMDPENQLCTDDFAGHLAHNTNLSLKAILALGAYGKLARMAGKTASANEYMGLARTMAGKWEQMAADGDHYRLAFDRPGTWSQKYNLVWDRLLDLNLFPASIAEKEVAFYLKTQKKYGLPLDNRETYTKLDWILWSATLTQKPEEWETLITPVYDFLNDTPDRVPMTDWYWTLDARRRGFTARSVVGGVFLKMLY